MGRGFSIKLLSLGLSLGGTNAVGAATLAVDRGFALLGRPIEIRLVDEQDVQAARIELVRLDSGATIDTGVAPGKCFDASEVFPGLKDNPPTTAVGLRIAGDAKGQGIILVPIRNPPRHENAMAQALRAANRSRDRAAIEALSRLSGAALDSLERAVVTVEPPERVFCGYRLLRSHRVRVRTSLGELTIAPRYDAAPATCDAFVRLVEAGFYDGNPIHRIVPPLSEDGSGGVIQAGDPSASGLGGSGERIAMESSTLAQGFGIVSMARVPGDPDSATGQIVIALGPDSAGTLKESATAFGVLTAGAEVLSELADVAIGSRRMDDPRSPRDRPIASLVIERAWAEPAPLTTAAPRPESPAPQPSIER